MLLRSLISALLCLLVAGCSGISAEDSARIAAGNAAGPRLVRLVDRLLVLPGKLEQIGVRYLDEAGAPVSGKLVTFGLSGAATGSSLAQTEAVTDAEGNAYTTLRVGSTLSTFQVRASADGVEPVLITVQISDIAEPSVSVSVRYDGARPIVSRTVGLVPGMRCDTITNVYKEQVAAGASSVLFEADATATFKLGSGLSYALVAWGSDDTNGKLAYGCLDIEAVPTPDSEQAQLTREVEIFDTLLDVRAGSFPLSFSLDVTQPLSTLKGSAEQAVLARLPKRAQAGAAFYIDAIESAHGPLGALRNGLDQELEGLLSQANGGPLELSARLAQLVSSQGGKAAVQATLSVPEANVIGTVVVSRVDAITSELAREVPRQGPLSATAQLESRYDESRAAIVIDSLSMQLGLGSYAVWLLDENGASAELVSQLSPAHGCPQVSLVVSKRPSFPITPAQAEAACQQAVASLVSSVRTAWLALDSDRPAIWFEGLIPVHDRDLDQTLRPRDDRRKVSDIGPAELSASWSSAFSTEAMDKVSATLRVPPSTALAL